MRSTRAPPRSTLPHAGRSAPRCPSADHTPPECRQQRQVAFMVAARRERSRRVVAARLAAGGDSKARKCCESRRLLAPPPPLYTQALSSEHSAVCRPAVAYPNQVRESSLREVYQVFSVPRDKKVGVVAVRL